MLGGRGVYGKSRKRCPLAYNMCSSLVELSPSKYLSPNQPHLKVCSCILISISLIPRNILNLSVGPLLHLPIYTPPNACPSHTNERLSSILVVIINLVLFQLSPHALCVQPLESLHHLSGHCHHHHPHTILSTFTHVSI